MQARDASGRQVSLLNDDHSVTVTHNHDRYRHNDFPQRLSYRPASHIIPQGFQPSLARSTSSSPNTPELLRSDSYDSQASNEPISPLTPNVMYDYGRGALHAGGRRSPYEDYMAGGHAFGGGKGPTIFNDSQSSSYEEDSAASPSAAAGTERAGKRYPCRYRDSHGCEKTFTTSGHASRHSKIHTAEKAVQCSHSGCTKKFTRADNMKQHLETHYKDKSRSASSRPSLSSGDRRSSSSSKSTKSSSRTKAAAAAAAAAAAIAAPLPSPGASGGAWDMRGLNLPLLSRPNAVRIPSSGLDALAMAIACQEGGRA